MNKETTENVELPSADELAELTTAFITEGLTFKAAKGISDADMEGIYSVGFNLYNSGKFEEAEKVFQFLCLFDHWNRKYWMGLGSTRQMLKQYPPALECYSYAALLKIEDPMAPLHAASCYLAMGDSVKAKSALKCAIKYSGDNADAKVRAEALLEFLEKKGDEVKE